MCKWYSRVWNWFCNLLSRCTFLLQFTLAPIKNNLLGLKHAEKRYEIWHHGLPFPSSNLTSNFWFFKHSIFSDLWVCKCCSFYGRIFLAFSHPFPWLVLSSLDFRLNTIHLAPFSSAWVCGHIKGLTIDGNEGGQQWRCRMETVSLLCLVFTITCT